MQGKKVYIVIVNYQNWEDTLGCIESLLASSYPDFSILVVDNHSGNESLEQIRKTVPASMDNVIVSRKVFSDTFRHQLLPKLVLIQNDSNAGFAAANNIVLQMVQQLDAYVWMLNPDMTVEQDAMQQLVDFADQQQGKKIIGSVVRSYEEKEKVLFYGGATINFNTGTIKAITHTDMLDKLDYISGASLFTHASSFAVAGLLPEHYFLIWEETDWNYGARQKGIEIAVCQTAVCYDKISTVIGKGFRAHYYYTRNGLYFISKYRKGKTGLVLVFAGLRLLKRILTGQWGQARGVWRGVFDYLKKKTHAME
ncbi:MAG: glycosyltransferase family 2 protein [Chitinophagaceae bacterium]